MSSRIHAGINAVLAGLMAGLFVHTENPWFLGIAVATGILALLNGMDAT